MDYISFSSLLEIPEVTDLLEVSDEKLSQLEPSPLKNLLKQFENNTVNSIWSGLEKKNRNTRLSQLLSKEYS
jgi:hypothetical protein